MRASLKLAPVQRKQRPTIAQMRRAIKLFSSEYATKEINKANRINWLKAVARLGDRWLLAKPQQRSA